MEFELLDEVVGQDLQAGEPVGGSPVGDGAVGGGSVAGGVVDGGGGVVWPGVVDVSGLSLLGLRERLELIKTSEAQLAAMKTSTLAEYKSRVGEGMARRMVTETLQASRQQARREVQTASQFAEVPKTLNALSAGEIPSAHATKIAKAASQGPVDETVLVEAARTQDYGAFTKTVRDHQHEQSGDDGQSNFERQRANRSLNCFVSPDDGMFILNGRFDPVAGSIIETALADETRRLRNQNAETNQGDLTGFDQLLADALVNLLHTDSKNNSNSEGNGNSEGGERKQRRPTLILTADWDVLKKQMINTRLLDDTPIPVAEAIKLACDADILPAVFNSKTQKLWLGRKHRSATEAQRCALIVRDKHCVGCGRTPTWCEAHHIQHWAHGGQTNLDNLVLVCTSCHHNIHDNGWQVVQNQDRKYDLRPPPNKTPQDAHRKHQLRPSPKPYSASRTPMGEHGNHQPQPPPKTYADMPTSQPCNPHPKTKTKKKPSGQPPHPKQPNRPTNPTGPTNTNTKTNRQPVLCN